MSLVYYFFGTRCILLLLKNNLMQNLFITSMFIIIVKMC